MEQEKRTRGRPKGSTDKTERKKRTDGAITAKPGENTKFILHDMKLMNLPDIDINNPSQVKQRINEYFSICAEDDTKPSVASLALSFHISRHDLFNWLNERSEGIKNQESLRTLKTAYNTINSYYEHMMNNGKINPVAGIFLMKNNMGYKDTTDYIVTANQDKQVTLPDIANRAGLLSE